MTAKHVFISGEVQGVWFRGWTVEQASALNLSGWVRNRRDGRVEAVIAGDQASLKRMIELFHRGPPAAGVTEVLVKDWPGELPDGFSQVATV